VKPWNIFVKLSDLRVSIVLFALIGVLSLVGVVNPGVFDSPVFAVCLYLFILNLVACIIVRIGRNFHSLRTIGPDAAGRARALGSIVLHTGVIFLFAGGVASQKMGYIRYGSLGIGATMPVQDRDFLLRVDDFSIDNNSKGEIKDYFSTLSIVRDSVVLVTKKIQVNDPLIFEGIHFYQSSYGKDPYVIQDAVLHISSDLMAIDTMVSVPYDDTIALGKRGMFVCVHDFFGDFVIDMKTREPSSRSETHNNPALKASLFDSFGSVLFDSWLFALHKGFHMQENPVVSIELTSYTPQLFTGIQIRKNPGVPLVWAGIGLASLGLVLIFYGPLLLRKKKRE